MKKLAKYLFLSIISIVLISCTNNPNDLSNVSETDLTYKYANILSYKALQKDPDGSIIVGMQLSVTDKTFNAFGKFSPELYNTLSKKRMIRSIDLERKENNQFLVKEVTLDFGVYGFAQYYLGYVWLSKFFSYNTALNLSFIPAIIIFLIIFILGAVFIEF